MNTVCKPGQLAVVNRNLKSVAEFARGWIIQVSALDTRYSEPFWLYEGSRKYFPNGEEISSFSDNILTPIPPLDELDGEDEMITIMKNKINKEENDKHELVEHS